MSLTPKNWKSFQHYKDRAPLWIKLHRGLLDNRDYHLLTPLAGKCLPLVWLLASEKDGIVPDPDELAFRLRINSEEVADVLEQLTRRGFLVHADEATHAEQDATLAQRIATSNGFGSRHISDAVKRTAWERDGGKCRKCGSLESIEYDHIHPVSKGGNSELENIQLLCRPCNRSKRVSVATQAQPCGGDSRSLEKENIGKRTREEEEKESRSASPPNDDFENLKKVYPRRNGNYGWKAAERKFNSLVKTGVDPKAIIAAAKRLGQTLHSKIGTEYIPMPASWLNAEDFVNIAVASFQPEETTIDWDNVLSFWKRTGRWTRDAGPDPDSPACRAPPELLDKYGLRTMQ